MLHGHVFGINTFKIKYMFLLKNAVFNDGAAFPNKSLKDVSNFEFQVIKRSDQNGSNAFRLEVKQTKLPNTKIGIGIWHDELLKSPSLDFFSQASCKNGNRTYYKIMSIFVGVFMDTSN